MSDNPLDKELLRKAWEAAKIREDAEKRKSKIVTAYSTDISEDSNKSSGFPIRQILGLGGSLILFIGVFTPIISLPIVGNVNYFGNGKGDGIIIVLLAALSIILTLTRKYTGLLFTGIGSLAILAFTFINFQLRMADAKSEMQRTMANNPFAGLGEAMFDTVQIQWGFAVLLIGASFLIAASLIEKNETLRD